jgi:cyclohexadienyl dehydratase
MKKIFLPRQAGLLILMALALCLLAGGAEAKTLKEIGATKILRVGLPGDYEPFAFPDYAGAYVGHDVDVANAIGDALGVEVLFVKSSWPTLTQDLLADKFDMAAGGITRTDARQKDGLLSDIAYYFGKSLIVRAGDKNKYKTLEDVNQPHVRVGVNPGGTNEKFARSNLPKAKITVVQDNMAIPAMVAKGGLDVMVSENVEVKKYLAKDARLAGVFVENTLTRDTGGYFFKKSDRELADFVNFWLSNAKVNGALDALQKKWLQ